MTISWVYTKVWGLIWGLLPPLSQALASFKSGHSGPMNREIGRIFHQATDPKLVTRTWQDAIDAYCSRSMRESSGQHAINDSLFQFADGSAFPVEDWQVGGE